MRAAWIAVGSELLGTERLDTNALIAAALLRRHGVELRRKAVVGDSEGDLESELRALLGGYELVLVSGGLGPTADDVTREAVARACGRSLVFEPKVVADIEERFRRIGRRMPEVNKRQAHRIDGAELLPNPRGTAPGQQLEEQGTAIFLLPGPPRELEPMLVEHVGAWLEARSGGEGTDTCVLKIACMPESEVEERIAPAYAELGRERVTVLAKPDEIRVEVTARGAAASRERELVHARARLRELLGDCVFAEGEDELEAVVGRLLRAAGATIATGESCTGGLVAERLTAVPGSSDYVRGGVVAYSNEAKQALLDVPAPLLSEHGAVSEPVARALAAGAARRLDATFGIGITGVAGPGGGSDAKPVGTVHIAIAGPEGGLVHRLARFPGERERVRWQASQLALELLRRELLRRAAAAAAAPSPPLEAPPIEAAG
ncbi:MAG TPA: competence/damage-inducible protein A [Thermoanaerobaculia bacterium]|jgi:nicotinamide-nucleotide amidase|nr:competence/damage-inducible protein A [Thermoanaerobaculia bacterium]